MGASFSLSKSESNCDKELVEAKLNNDNLSSDNIKLKSALKEAEAKSKSNYDKELLEFDSSNDSLSSDNRKLASDLIEAKLKLEEATKNAKKNDFSDATIGVNNANHQDTERWVLQQDKMRAETEKIRKTQRVTDGYAVYDRKRDTLTIKKPNGSSLEISGFKTSQNDNKDNLMFECLYPRDYPINHNIKPSMGSNFICKGGDTFGLSRNSLKLATGGSETTDTSYIESITIRNPTMINVNTKQSISDIKEVTILLNRELGKTEAEQAAIDEAVNSIKITPRKDTEEYIKQQKKRIGGKRIKRKTKRRRNSKGKSKRNTVRFNQ